MLLAKAILILTFLSLVNSWYNYGFMTFEQIVGAAIEDAYLASKELVEKNHYTYLYNAKQKFTQQKLT